MSRPFTFRFLSLPDHQQFSRKMIYLLCPSPASLVSVEVHMSCLAGQASKQKLLVLTLLILTPA